MTKANYRLQYVARKLLQQLTSRLYRNPDPAFDHSIMVAGTARSGTSWLGDLVASQIPSRIIFEPFNPVHVSEYRKFEYFQYLRPQQQEPDFLSFSQQVFSGNIRNRWVDKNNERLLADYRLIKEIRANLSLKWLRSHFPEVRMLFIIRHPCAVVLSRMALEWATDGDIAPFLAQAALVEDHLADHLATIQAAATDEEKHAIIWSISTLIPLRQLQPGDVKIVFYENLCTQPEIELQAIFQYLGFPDIDYAAIMPSFNRPSLTAKPTSAVLSGHNKVTAWQQNLSNAQILRIQNIVRAFGLGHLYGDSFMPITEDPIFTSTNTTPGEPKSEPIITLTSEPI